MGKISKPNFLKCTQQDTVKYVLKTNLIMYKSYLFKHLCKDTTPFKSNFLVYYYNFFFGRHFSYLD